MTRNAIIMAAGMSSRFAPLSLETPKALLNVKDEIMIERQIGQLREAGIDEIVIVVGYLKEKFEYLKEKYHVILVENPYYKQMNNFSTLYVAREYLKIPGSVRQTIISQKMYLWKKVKMHFMLLNMQMVLQKSGVSRLIIQGKSQGFRLVARMHG